MARYDPMRKTGKRGGRKVTPELIDAVIQLKQAGAKNREIAMKTGLSESAVSAIWAKFQPGVD